MSETGVPITPGTGAASIASELTNGFYFQQVEIYGGGGASVMTVNPDGSINSSIVGTVKITGSVQASFSPTGNQSVSGTVGASIIGAVPVTLYTTPSSLVSGVTSVITGTASVLVLAAPTGVQRNYITQVLVTNGSATSTFVDVVDNGQIIYSGYAAASGGGFSASFPAPLKQPTSGLGLFVFSSVQASIVVSASGYTAP